MRGRGGIGIKYGFCFTFSEEAVVFREEVSRIQSISLSLHTARWDGSKNSNGESGRKAPWFQATTQSPRVALLCECLVCCCCLVDKSCLTPWTIAHQAPVSMGFSRQECWSGLPFPSPGDLPEPGVEPASSALAGRFFTVEAPGKPSCLVTVHYDSVSLRILCLLLNTCLFLCLNQSHLTSVCFSC